MPLKRAFLILVVVLAPMVTWWASPAYAACTPETSIFVRSNVNVSYGNKGTFFVYYRSLAASCGTAQNTMHVAVSQNGLNYVEGGTRQFSSDFLDATGPDHYRMFFSYRDYPQQIYQYYQPILRSTGELTSVAIYAVGTGSTWRMQYLPPGGSWTTMATSPAMVTSYGVALSEIARYGGSATSAQVSVSAMQRKALASSQWVSWTAIECPSFYAANMPDWNAKWSTGNAWYTDNEPPAGGC